MGLQFRPAAEVARHVGADFHLGSWCRSEVKVRIEARDRVNLAYWDVDARSKLLELIRRQVAKLLLDRPELVEQGASVPLSPDHDGKICRNLIVKDAQRECRSWDTRMTRGPVPTCGPRTKLSIDSGGWNRYIKRIRCENRARVLTDARRDAQQGQPGVACGRVSGIPFFIAGAKHSGGEVQRPGRVCQQ
jgi:hypothetical protein